MRFIAPGKLILFVKYLDFCPDYLGHVGKWFDKKAKVIFIFCDINNWKKKYYNKFIA